MKAMAMVVVLSALSLWACPRVDAGAADEQVQVIQAQEEDEARPIEVGEE